MGRRHKGKAMGNKKAYYAEQFSITNKNLAHKNKTNKKKKATK